MLPLCHCFHTFPCSSTGFPMGCSPVPKNPLLQHEFSKGFHSFRKYWSALVWLLHSLQWIPAWWSTMNHLLLWLWCSLYCFPLFLFPTCSACQSLFVLLNAFSQRWHWLYWWAQLCPVVDTPQNWLEQDGTICVQHGVTPDLFPQRTVLQLCHLYAIQKPNETGKKKKNSNQTCKSIICIQILPL